MPSELDDNVLREIGFSSHDELTAFLQKLNRFVDSLTDTEKNVLRATLPAIPDAVRTFDTSVTETQLHTFIAERTPPEAEFISIVNGVLKSKL